MEQWIGKVAVVTGASSGIGAAATIDLVKAGCIVVGLARRVEKVQALEEKLENANGKLYARQCDITKLESIKETFAWIESEIGPVSILINNAGVGTNSGILTENNEDEILNIINTNVLGLVFCTKEAYKSFKKHDSNGFVININSMAGHRVPPFPMVNVYSASKYAVTAATQTLNMEMGFLKNSKVRFTSISPGFVDTEILDLIKIRDIASKVTILKAEDISAEILHVLSRPPHVHIHEIILKSTESP